MIKSKLKSRETQERGSTLSTINMESDQKQRSHLLYLHLTSLSYVTSFFYIKFLYLKNKNLKKNSKIYLADIVLCHSNNFK